MYKKHGFLLYIKPHNHFASHKNLQLISAANQQRLIEPLTETKTMLPTDVSPCDSATRGTELLQTFCQYRAYPPTYGKLMCMRYK